MNAKDKYLHIFGKIDSLAERISWSTGVSNMLDWITRSTNDILGVTKTKYRKKIIDWCHEAGEIGLPIEGKHKYVESKIKDELDGSERNDRYDKPSSSIASPREALRRAKYFSEDYLNKEFDIFWSLVSDEYLDEFYGQFTTLNKGGEWFSHGNSGLFANSTCIREMQMDNLCYSPTENILIANELKLGGKKNPDQILKHSLMYRLLVERGFIQEGARFLLLFIGDKYETSDWDSLIHEEIAYCQSKDKSTLKKALHPEGIEIAQKSQYESITWNDLVRFNAEYRSSLNLPMQQVESKLLWGFNETLGAKAFMVPDDCDIRKTGT